MAGPTSNTSPDMWVSSSASSGVLSGATRGLLRVAGSGRSADVSSAETGAGSSDGARFRDDLRRPSPLPADWPDDGACLIYGQCDTLVVNFPQLSAEHPTLTATAVRLLGVLRDWPAQVQPAPGGSVWMHHIDFAERTVALERHLRSALLVADAGYYFSALALTRTALEHHLLDRLLLLADRYEETIRPPDPAQIEQWEADFAAGTEPWTRDVASITRTKDGRALKLVRNGYDVASDAGTVEEQISPYWPALEHYDAFLGHPDLQAAIARPFNSVEDLESWARRNQAVYGSFLKWSSMLWNLQLSGLVTAADLVQLQLHYAFLSAFAHSTTNRRDGGTLGRPGGPPVGHVLGELVLLYVIVIALAETRAWSSYRERRPQLLAPLDQSLQQQLASAGTIVDYLWFLGGSPQPFDFYEEANRRAHPLLLNGERPAFTPATIPSVEVGYYSNPVDRLSRMHIGENEMSTGFGFLPAWSSLYW